MKDASSYKAAAVTTIQWIWMATLALARFTWAATRWTARVVWAVTRWAGRVALWVLCWPIALYRGHNKKVERRHQELVAAASGFRPSS